jgi:diguanylate cyclase (GGDEF)-like protein
MRNGRRQGAARIRGGGFRSWSIWELPRWLVTYIFVVTSVYAVAIAAAAVTTRTSTRDLVLCAALMLCTVATVELTRRAGESAGLTRDVYAVWELPLAILLPPLYALTVPIFRLALNQWRIRQVSVHRRVFSAAIVGLSYGSASLAFHAMDAGRGAVFIVTPAHTSLLAHASTWLLAVALAAFVQWCVNTVLLVPAVKGSEPTAPIRDLVFAAERLHNDIAEFCVAVLVTLGIAVTPITILLAFPLVTVLQRSFRHAQLVNASRIDSKTGLLNAGTWEREAASEVARAIRTRSPLAVALIDIDHFKAVNDAHGHLVGDRALKAISTTLTVFLREYDLVGRFGGEEFALILPQTRAVDAYRIAERIRAYIAGMLIDTGGEPGEDHVSVTVSIGVAALGARWDTSAASHLTDLLAAADVALYRAKRDGRDQVCVLTEKATFLSAHPQATRSPADVPVPGEAPPPDKANISSPEPAGSQA